MIQKNLKSISGLTLIEILIGIVVSSIMMAAIYTTYSIVNNTYGQVLEKAHSLRVKRGANNIEDIDVASAIKCLVWER